MDSDDSANSEVSTLPNTPGDVANVFTLDKDEVFAWLRPLSDNAQEAFDATVNAVLKHPAEYDYFRHFLHCDSRQDRSQSIITEDGNANHDPSPIAPYRWRGAFGLRLTYPPNNPIEGWYMGTNHARNATNKVDLLLLPPSKQQKKTRIAGHHATMRFHKECCRISLQARHTIKICRNGVQAFRQSESILLEPGEVVFIGDCAYTFEYTDYFHSAAFDQALTLYMRNFHQSLWSMNKHISPGSVGLPSKLGNYYCSPRAFAQGTFGKISAGWTQSGATVAIKTFKNPNEYDLRSHMQLMEFIGEHVSLNTSDN